MRRPIAPTALRWAAEELARANRRREDLRGACALYPCEIEIMKRAPAGTYRRAVLAFVHSERVAAILADLLRDRRVLLEEDGASGCLTSAGCGVFIERQGRIYAVARPERLLLDLLALTNERPIRRFYGSLDALRRYSS